MFSQPDDPYIENVRVVAFLSSQLDIEDKVKNSQNDHFGQQKFSIPPTVISVPSNYAGTVMPQKWVAALIPFDERAGVGFNLWKLDLISAEQELIVFSEALGVSSSLFFVLGSQGLPLSSEDLATMLVLCLPSDNSNDYLGLDIRAKAKKYVNYFVYEYLRLLQNKMGVQ